MAAIFPIVLLSCKKDDIRNENNLNDLIGSWVDPSYNENQIEFEKSAELKDNEYGFTFMADGEFIERKNSGWCGTPPISYADFDGTWMINDSIINITVAYWGGEIDYRWKIVVLHDKKLKVIEEYNIVE